MPYGLCHGNLEKSTRLDARLVCVVQQKHYINLNCEQVSHFLVFFFYSYFFVDLWCEMLGYWKATVVSAQVRMIAVLKTFIRFLRDLKQRSLTALTVIPGEPAKTSHF